MSEPHAARLAAARDLAWVRLIRGLIEACSLRIGDTRARLATLDAAVRASVGVIQAARSAVTN
ncbi:hypothetical protein [Streptomyces sp. HUAS ZL42]|uniref:hypothetical protein n=1 Tax=Streptomyces sp. HUAS ZL42 TaxID=3231715 RepID=UPI00345EF1D6